MNFYSDNYQVGCQFVTFRKYFHRTRLWPEMHSLRLSRGVLFTAIGWFLSADAILGAFAFLMVRMSVGEFGGRYPPDLIFFLIWPLLLAGVFVSYHGSLLQESSFLTMDRCCFTNGQCCYSHLPES